MPKNDIINDPNIELIYTEITRQYNVIRDSSNTLDNKSNGLMIFNGSFIALVTTAFIQLIILLQNNHLSFSVLLIILPYIFLIGSFILLIKSFYVHLPSKNPRDFFKLLDKPTYELIGTITANIIDEMNHIEITLMLKSKYFRYSIISLFSGILTFALVFIYYINFYI